MADIVHELTIDAPRARVFDAIVTRKGLSSWWTQDVEAEPKVGSIAVFRFGGASTVFRMKVKGLSRGRRVAWHCVGDAPEWQGTGVTFELRPGETRRETVLRFTHAGWRSAKGWMGTCSYTWAHVLARLKRYAETRKPVAYFRGYASR